MDVFTMTVIIVLIGCASGVVSTYFKSRSKKGGKDLTARVEAIEAQIAHDESLEERVRALETIVTDRKHRLDQEIRSLH